MTGEFSVHHNTTLYGRTKCQKNCWTDLKPSINPNITYPFVKERDQGKGIKIISRLSPCKAYSGIKIRAEARSNVYNEVTTNWTPVWNPEVCPQITTTTTTRTTETTTISATKKTSTTQTTVGEQCEFLLLRYSVMIRYVHITIVTDNPGWIEG